MKREKVLYYQDLSLVPDTNKFHYIVKEENTIDIFTTKKPGEYNWKSVPLRF